MSQDRLRSILAEVVKIDERVAAFVAAHAEAFAAVDARYQRSAENLLRYVGLRQLELRRLQLELGEWGLTSLGRSEGHVRSSLRELRARLDDSLAIVRAPTESSAPALSQAAAEQAARTREPQPTREQTPGCKRSSANGEVRLAILPYGRRNELDSRARAISVYGCATGSAAAAGGVSDRASANRSTSSARLERAVYD